MIPMGLSLYRCSLGPATPISNHANQLSLAHGLGALVPWKLSKSEEQLRVQWGTTPMKPQQIRGTTKSTVWDYTSEADERCSMPFCFLAVLSAFHSHTQMSYFSFRVPLTLLSFLFLENRVSLSQHLSGLNISEYKKKKEKKKKWLKLMSGELLHRHQIPSQLYHAR